jgi:prolyl-tRNA editing enzyme YbaK/EbsC (Cys-tRNA(Pro) deacylase)
MPATSTIHEFLREAHVPYTVVPHHPAFTAQEEAAATHVPGRDWAKVVVCFVDGQPVEAVLPAPFMVQSRTLAGAHRRQRDSAGARGRPAAIVPGV